MQVVKEGLFEISIFSLSTLIPAGYSQFSRFCPDGLEKLAGISRKQPLMRKNIADWS